jgi:hypothetical protein
MTIPVTSVDYGMNGTIMFIMPSLIFWIYFIVKSVFGLSLFLIGFFILKNSMPIQIYILSLKYFEMKGLNCFQRNNQPELICPLPHLAENCTLQLWHIPPFLDYWTTNLLHTYLSILVGFWVYGVLLAEKYVNKREMNGIKLWAWFSLTSVTHLQRETY